MGDARQIVTGVTEKGAETVIRYWIQQRGSKQPKESGSLTVRVQSWPYVPANVRER